MFPGKGLVPLLLIYFNFEFLFYSPNFFFKNMVHILCLKESRLDNNGIMFARRSSITR